MWRPYGAWEHAICNSKNLKTGPLRTTNCYNTTGGSLSGHDDGTMPVLYLKAFWITLVHMIVLLLKCFWRICFFFNIFIDIVFSSRAAEETAPCSRTPRSSGLTDHNLSMSAPPWFIWQEVMQKAYLTAAHIAARRQWVRVRRRWTRQQWQQILFSDETRIYLCSNDGGWSRALRRRGERHAANCIQLVVPYQGGSIMVWGGISSHGKQTWSSLMETWMPDGTLTRS